jgi:methylase of polypeptide subunit release factors
MVTADDALLELLGELRSRDYRFTCVTPATHQRVLDRPDDGKRTLQGIFGWNRTFAPEQLDASLLRCLEQADRLEHSDKGLRSMVRVASLGDELFLHSSYPTTSADAVFFGPDTYRFARFVLGRLPSLPSPRWIVDMGAGSGAGAIVTAKHLASARLTLVDINPAAADLARVNARFAGVEVEILLSDSMPEGCDLVIANPPYLLDEGHRTYRDGGGMLGGEVACEWVRQALSALAPAGTMLLYTGAAVVRGSAQLTQEIASLCAAGAELQVEEIDPDVFGEELERPAYADVDRIAALGMSIRART